MREGFAKFMNMEFLSKLFIIVLWVFYRTFSFAFFLNVPNLNEFSNNQKKLSESILLFFISLIGFVSCYFLGIFGIIIPLVLLLCIIVYSIILTSKMDSNDISERK